MNRKWVISGVIIGCLIAYFILISIISSILSVNLSLGSTENSISQEGGDTKIGISDSIGVTVQRNRWYGRIIENSESGGTSKTLYILGFIRIPLESGGTSLLLWHIILILGLGTLGYYMLNRVKRHHYERGYY